MTGMPDKHAFLSPSSSVRWYFCPPSARLCEQFPDQGNVFASEGTEAHALCEFLLKDALGMECADPRPTLQYYTEEMEDAARGYVRYILEKTAAYRAAAAGTGSGMPIVFVEQRLDLREYIPESMGTADCVILAGDTAEVIDFKYGMHRVPATSMQLRIYALGACEVFSWLYDLKTVRMAIYQPRIGASDETEMSVADLYAWAREELVPKARQAFDGEGEFTCGEWCRMCRARRNCRALAEYELELEKHGLAAPELLSDEEIAGILERIDGLVSWANGIREYALENALNGHKYPGFRLAEGRSVRKFANDAEAAQRLESAGQDPWEKKLMSIPALEKMLGKRRFTELLSDLVIRPKGKMMLVRV